MPGREVRCEGLGILLQHLHCDNPPPTVARGEAEGSVAAQPVQLRDHQIRARDLGPVHDLGLFRPLLLAPAFHPGEPRQHLAAAGGCEVPDQLAPCFQPEARLALPRLGDPLESYQSLPPVH